jgi:hypothetical protein
MAARLLNVVQNPAAKAAFIGLGLVVGVAAVKAATKAVGTVKIQAIDRKFQIEHSLSDSIMKQFQVIVETVYDEIHGSWFSDDEAKIVEYVNSFKTTSQVQIGSALYQKRYGNSLKNDVTHALSDGINSIPFLGWLGAKYDMSKINQIVQDNWY